MNWVQKFIEKHLNIYIIWSEVYIILRIKILSFFIYIIKTKVCKENSKFKSYNFIYIYLKTKLACIQQNHQMSVTHTYQHTYHVKIRVSLLTLIRNKI